MSRFHDLLSKAQEAKVAQGPLSGPAALAGRIAETRPEAAEGKAQNAVHPAALPTASAQYVQMEDPQDRKAGPALPSTQGVSPSMEETLPKVFGELAKVTCSIRPEDRIIGCSQNHNIGAEKFRFLLHRLTRLRERRAISKVLVTSTVPKEGKTVVAINLAVSLAGRSSRVLLVDADLRQPRGHRALGRGSDPGLAELLEGKGDLASVVHRLDPLGIYYLPSGKASRNPFELLEGPRMREVVEAMKAFDWVIFDSPPLTTFADGYNLASLSDAVLLIVRPGLTPRDSLQQVLGTLNPAQLAGVVLNAVEDGKRDAYYYRYYPRGKKVISNE